MEQKYGGHTSQNYVIKKYTTSTSNTTLLRCFSGVFFLVLLILQCIVV